MLARQSQIAFRTAVFLLALGLAAQLAMGAGRGRPPVSFDRDGLTPLDQLAGWLSPAVDVASLLAEDEANRGRKDIPYRIGHPMRTDLFPSGSGTWEDLVDGDRLWRLKVSTRDALWTVLGFDVFNLEPGGELWVYTPDRQDVRGPFTAADIRRHGELWFPPMAGDTLVVELFWPGDLASVEPGLHLGTVSHGYKPFGSLGYGQSTEGVDDSGSCNIDVACPLGDAWQDQKRGAVILLSGGSGFCSGSLINTTADDCRTYLLTANHCGAGASTTIGFNFEKPECGAGTPPPATNQTISGATVLASYSGSDFTLLEMDEAPPEEFGAYFNGWSRELQGATESWGIHHPSGDVKKISHNWDPLVDGVNYGPDHWRVTEWEEGTTEPGSSGSPIFDQNHRIVGQLHGGQASCTNITWDEYGKVAVSWTGGGSPSSRLQDWLDPDGTGAMTVDGVDHSTCMFQPAGELTLAASLYSCSGVLSISLRDDSLQGAPTQDVTVTSDSEASPETVTLTAIEPGSGRFLGTFPLSEAPAAGGDGALSVVHGDTVTVEYLDADDGQGGTNLLRQAFATVDCQAPAISNVGSGAVTGSAAVITWDTDEPADSLVTYGELTPGAAASDGAVVTSHSVTLVGLDECTVYVFSVSSVDVAGNPATDDNGGAFYSFATGVNNQPEFASTDTPIPITDNTTITSSIVMADGDTVLDVDVRLNATHTYTGDLDIFLIGPQGTRVELSTDNGGSGNDLVDTVFDDEASTSITAGASPFTGSYRPEGSLAALDGISSAGTWTLEITDDAGADQGQLLSWTLILTFEAQQCGPVMAFMGQQLEIDACSSGAVGMGNGLWEVGEQVEFSLTVKNDGTDPLTGAKVDVTPITPGVVMLDGTATVGDLAPGVAATTQPPHLIAKLTEALTCGQAVEFQVEMVAGEGAWPATFGQVIGEVIPERSGTTLSEAFSGGIPGTWTVIDGSRKGTPDGVTWFPDRVTDPAGCGSPDPAAPFAGYWAAADSSCAGGGTRMDEELITPAMDLTGESIVTLEFDHWFAASSGEIADVDIRSSLTGGAWVNLARFTGASTANPQHEVLDISAQAGSAPDVQIRWHYHEAQSELYWYLDNVLVHYYAPAECLNETCLASGSTPPPVPDGSGGTVPIQVEMLSPDGSALSVSWDDQCSPLDAKILYGPLVAVATYGLAGAVCGLSNPQVWEGVPSGDLWFVLVGEDGLGAESSWGLATAGERNGLTASGLCTGTVKDLSATCP